MLAEPHSLQGLWGESVLCPLLTAVCGWQPLAGSHNTQFLPLPSFYLFFHVWQHSPASLIFKNNLMRIFFHNSTFYTQFMRKTWTKAKAIERKEWIGISSDYMELRIWKRRHWNYSSSVLPFNTDLLPARTFPQGQCYSYCGPWTNLSDCTPSQV